MRIAGRRSGVCPRVKHSDLFRRERRIIREMADMRIGKPWRHGLALRRCRNSSRIGPRLFIRVESHRRDALDTVANLAALLQNRQHIVVESRLASNGALLSGGLR